MANQYVWIGISVAVFFAGFGVSYAMFASTYDPTTMKFRNQELFDQMMSNNPKMTATWMDSTMMNDSMMQNSQIMQSWMNTMMNDPELGQEIMNQMMQNPQMMEAIMQNQQMMGGTMMGSGMMGQGMQGQGMMGSGMTTGSMVAKTGAQLAPTTIENEIKNNEIIAIGTIQSIETQLIDESYSSSQEWAPGKRIEFEMKRPYYFVTIKVDEYLNDQTGQFSEFLTFKDIGEGMGVYNGEPVYFTNEYVGNHTKGEQALFFVDYKNGNYSSVSYIKKFTFDNITEKIVPSKYFSLLGKYPENIDELKTKIIELQTNSTTT